MMQPRLAETLPWQGWRMHTRRDDVQDMIALVAQALASDDTELLYYGFASGDGEDSGAELARELVAVTMDRTQREVVWRFGRCDADPREKSPQAYFSSPVSTPQSGMKVYPEKSPQAYFSSRLLALQSGMKVCPEFPSLASQYPGALWIEREMWEKTGYTPVGHPDLRPILHPEKFLPDPVARGSGTFHLPLGPVRADVTESGFFLFDTIGEQIMHMQPQLFYKHRDMEKLAVGMTAEDALLLAERISGTSTAAHATAFCRAAEQALGYRPSLQNERERMLFGEMERLYNHVHDFSQLASATGMTVAQAQFARAKEELLRLNAEVTGSRYLRGAVRLGRSASVDWERGTERLTAELPAIDRRVRRFLRLLLHTPTFIDRLRPTGIVEREWAKSYGVVGPVARACGLAVDARSDCLRHLYEATGYACMTAEDAFGDALSRFRVRVREWDISLHIVLELLPSLGTSTLVETELSQARGKGIGVAESPRGRVCHVLFCDNGKVVAWGIRAASAWNWPVFGLAAANGNIQTDFPIIDASFGLSYAGLDR